MRLMKRKYGKEYLNQKFLRSMKPQREKSPSITNIPETNLSTDKLAAKLPVANSNIVKEFPRKFLKTNLMKNKEFKQRSCSSILQSEGILHKEITEEVKRSASKLTELDFNESNISYTKSHKLCEKPNFEDKNSIKNKRLQEINDLRLKGNIALKNKDYELAIQFYTKGFSIDSESDKYNSLLHSDVGYVQMVMNNHPDAIEYFEKAISLDENNFVAKHYKILCLIKTKEFDDAEKEANELLSTNNSKENRKLMNKIWKRKGDYYKKEGDKNKCEFAYMKALKSLTSLIESNETDESLIKRAEVFMKMNLISEAIIDVEKVLTHDPKNVDAKIIQIKLLMLSEAPIQQLIDHILELYSIDSSDQNMQLLKNIYIKKGMVHLDESEFQEAMESYNEAIKFAPHDVSLYEMRAKIAEQINDCFTIITDTSHAIEMGSTDIDNWVLRSKCLLKQELYKEAYEDASFAYSRTLSPKIAMLVREAEEGILRNSTETFYDVLGVNFGASNKEIKERYSKLSLRYLPDKWSKVNEYFRNAFQEKFRKVLESYKTLTDPALKRMYDMSLSGS